MGLAQRAGWEAEMRLAGCCLLITGIFGTLLLGFGYFLIDRNSNMTIALPALLIAIAFGALLVFRPETPADSVVIEGEESDKAAAQDSSQADADHGETLARIVSDPDALEALPQVSDASDLEKLIERYR
jgi:hypothetical protein